MTEQGAISSDPKDLEYLQWMDDNGIKLKNCSIGHFPKTGRGCIATQDIQKDQVVIEVPDDMVLLPDSENVFVSESLKDTLFGHRGGENTKNESIGLALALVGERLAGEKSNWYGYIDSLPSVDVKLWEAGKSSFLKESALCKMPSYGIAPNGWAGSDADTALEVFKDAALPLIDLFSELKEHATEKDSNLKKRQKKNQNNCLSEEELQNLFYWALCIVASYSFELGDEQFHGLVPYFDMLNHITGKVNVRLNHDNVKGVLQMIAIKDIPKNTELVNCYGPHTPVQLKRCYGYIDHVSVENPFDASFIRAPDFVQSMIISLHGDSKAEDENIDAYDRSIDTCLFLYELHNVCLAPQIGWVKPSLPGCVHALIQTEDDLKEVFAGKYANLDKDDLKCLISDFNEMIVMAYLAWASYFHKRTITEDIFVEDRVSSFLDNELEADEFAKICFDREHEASIYKFVSEGNLKNTVAKIFRNETFKLTTAISQVELDTSDIDHSLYKSDALIILKSERNAAESLANIFDETSELTGHIRNWTDAVERAFLSYLEGAKKRASELMDLAEDSSEDGHNECDDSDCEDSDCCEIEEDGDEDEDEYEMQNSDKED